MNPSVVPAGGAATWTLSAMAGPVSVGDLYSSGTAWGGTWTNQWSGNYSWGVSGGALWYAPGTCATESNYPQYINSGVTVGDAEFYYETLIPPIGCQPQEDSVLIFRNVSCARYYMIRLDHFMGMDGCSSDPALNSTASRLFYDTVVPNGNPCGTPGVSSGTFNDGVGSASITCIAKNTWYSVRLRVLLNNVLAKTWPTGSAEPAGWMLNATDSTLNTYTSGQFGFQAQQGQTAFKNMTISTVSSEAVTVTDNFPACVGNVTWLGGGGAGHILSGNNLTWNIGTLSSSSTGVTCTLTSSISNSCTGAVANVALPNNGNSVTATVNVFNFTLAKTLRSPSLPVTGNGPLTFQIQLCTSGSGTLGGVSLTGGGAAATVADSSMITLVDNLSSNYSGIWNHTGYGDSGYIGMNSTGWFNATNMSYNAAPGGFSGGTMGMTLQLTNLVGGTCVTLFDVYQENNFVAHSCAGVTNNAYLAGNSGVTALPVAVTYTCGNSTYTVTPTPTPNVSYTPTYTRTNTPTPSVTATPTRTFTGTPTWTYTTGVGGPVVLKSVNPSTASVGDNVTWTLFAQPGPATIGNVYSSGTAWAGTWTNQVAGSFSWAVSGGALWYDAVCGPETGFPQYINSDVMLTGDVEFSYDTMIPPIGCQPLEDSVLIFRNVACNRFFMMRLDHYQGSDGCSSSGAGMSRLFYGKAAPNGNACGDTSGYFNAITEAYGASIDCVVKNTWYSMKVKTCGTTIMAKTWQVGTAEPGNWQLSTTDSDLATYTSGSFGFQANTGQTAFRNLTVSTISTQNVTVTDALPNCLSNAALVGSPSKGSAVLSGNTVTWSVGTMGDCDLPAALTLSSKLSSCTAGSWVVNTANTANGLSGSASVWVATPNPVSIQLTKTIVSPTGLYLTGNIAVSINVCNASGSATAGAVSIMDLVTQGGGNLSWCGPYSSYTLTAGGATVTIGAMMTQSTTAGMITVNNLPGGSCVPVTFCMTDYGIASHSCITILDNAVASWSGGAVTSAQKAVTYDCPSSTPTRTPTSTYTMTETPTPTISFTTTWTSTSTCSRTPSDTSTSTATPGTTATWTVGITPCDHIGIFGDSTIESTASNTTGVVAANKYTFPVSSTLGSLSLYASGKGLFRLAVYSDNGMGTAPATLLVEAGPQTVDGAGWYTEAVSATTLAAGDYWLALQTDSGVTTYFNLNGTAMPYITQAFGNFPATYSGSTTCACSIITMRANTCYSGTPLPTATWTVTPLLTATRTPSSTPTRTYTPTNTGTPTVTFTTTETPTGTWYTATSTMTGTPTFTSTRTNTPSVTATGTASYTPTDTATGTPSYTPTRIWTPTVTFTTTETPTGTFFTATPTVTYTPTQTGTPTMTFTITETPMGTWYTATPTMTGTPTFTLTRTNTPSVTSTGTPSSTPTRTYTPTNTGTPTVTFTTTETLTGTWYTTTSTMTRTSTTTPTWSSTPIATWTSTITSTATASYTLTPIYSFTRTGTPTSTHTATTTFTNTSTVSFTPSNTFANTATVTPVFSQTRTLTPTATDSTTAVFTSTDTHTSTATFTPSATATQTVSSTATFTRTFTATQTFTAVFTDTFTSSMTSTPTSTASSTDTPTVTETSTVFPSLTDTPVFTPNATNTPVQNVQEIVIGVPYPNPILDGSTVTLDLKVLAASTVKWKIFTVSYREIMHGSRIVSGSRARLVWDLKDDWGRPLNNGLYFMSVEVSGSMNSKKILKIMVER